MMNDAIRVAREYAPSMLDQLDQSSSAQSGSSSMSMQNEGDENTPKSLAIKATGWEKKAEYVQAISCYLKITKECFFNECN